MHRQSLNLLCHLCKQRGVKIQDQEMFVFFVHFYLNEIVMHIFLLHIFTRELGSVYLAVKTLSNNVDFFRWEVGVTFIASQLPRFRCQLS